ncbi:MAG: CDP-diacylglycerol--serine O-phosphatidyltransferase [Ignavibacteria bacterium]|nr:CDP-diacylglycerol--serine O-phosphatidyltransferase [Ignavibacteria bacterium]
MNRPRLTPSVIPNLFTSLNMFCGFLSILSASEGNYIYSAWLIFTAAIFDALDGLVARLTNSSSELGVELDSLSDIVSFGAAPSFLLYKSFFYSMDTWGIIISAVPLIAGGFRLARFNVHLVGFSKSFFLGLPIPSSALTIASFVLAFYNEGYPKPISDFITPMILVLSYLMVSNIRYETLPKLSLKSIKEKPYHFIFLIASAILVVIMNKKGLFLVFVFMILIGILRYLYKLITSRPNNN